MSDGYAQALLTVRTLLAIGHPLDTILEMPIVPESLRAQLRAEIADDQNLTLVPARTISAHRDRVDWVTGLDRSEWYYWPTLRQFLLVNKRWSPSAIRSLDDSSDRILRQLAPPNGPAFDIRGLVLGYVQSGKTANFTALIAKAADAGYRLVIVLSGVDNGLRRQTNARLKKELVGYAPPRIDSVPLPPRGKQWHEFTRAEMSGDFQPGHANPAALQGSEPVLLVVKKNGAVLRRLKKWLDQAPSNVRRELRALVVDDEADQASIDTRGSVPSGDPDDEAEYEPPSVINRLIREILGGFEHRAFVAYTATPFANILIPHDVNDPTAGNDLYPKDFIVDLPKQPGYFGAEEFFGRFDSATDEPVGGLDVIRNVADSDVELLEDGLLPESAMDAVVDFVLAGAGRAERGDGSAPAAMLVHTSMRVAEHRQVTAQLTAKFAEFRDEWRYQRAGGILERLRTQWESDQSRTTRRIDASRERPFSAVEGNIGPFLESIEVREVNSATGEVLDYEREPSLKAIVIGGNRLARGLTIEGLLVSYFVRRSMTYDTLMQMGRWFGYRAGFEDLTRIYTTSELAEWFSDLAMVEYRLRESIGIYEDLRLTPAEVGLRIWKHPVMQVTSALKQRFAKPSTIKQSYDLSLEQTFKFPFSKPEILSANSRANLDSARQLVDRLGRSSTESRYCWSGVDVHLIADFLNLFQQDSIVRSVSIPLILQYIEECLGDGELKDWTVAIHELKIADPLLGVANWGANAPMINQVSRTRLKGTDSLGVITTPGDELLGLPESLVLEARRTVQLAKDRGKIKAINTAAREVRPATNGLLLLYPISRYSGHSSSESSNRQPLFSDPADEKSTDIIGLALSFPRSTREHEIETFVSGTVPWKTEA